MGRLVAVAALVTAAVGMAAPTPAAAAGPAPDVALVSQDPWTILGGNLTLVLRTRASAPGVTVSVTAHQALTSRSAFARTTTGDRLGGVLDQLELPLDALALDPISGTRTLVLALEAPDSARDAARLGVRRAGVYPLNVELRDDDQQTIAGFVTYVVAVEADLAGVTPLEPPLGVAWVWPLQTPPALLPDGRPDPAVAAALGPTGRIGRQAAALARAPDVPVTLVPGPETLQSWEALARDDPVLEAGVTAIRLAILRSQVLAGSYVPVDLPSLLAGGLTGAVNTQLVRGDEALRDFFGTRADTGTALARPVDSASLGRLRSGGVDRVIVDGGAVAPSDSQFTRARPFLLEAPGSTLTALAADDELSGLLTGDAPAALRAQRVLAGLAVTALETPEEQRVVVLLNPGALDAPASLFDAVLAGLRSHPWLQPVTVASAFEVPPEAGENGAAVIRELAPYSPPAPPVTAAAYEAASTRLSSFRSLVPPDDVRPAHAERALLSSVSSAWNSPEGSTRARADLAAVDSSIVGFLAQIRVPNPTTITLTSRSGEIPLTFRNDTGRAVSVLLRLESQKLSFPDGPSMLVDLKPRSTTIRVPVEARTSGSFPLRLSVRSADGILPIAATDVRVRSTVVSTVGLGLMIGAGVFLAVWWAFDIRRRRAKSAQTRT